MNDERHDSEDTHNLIRQAQAGDSDAFEQLFSAHRGYLQKTVELRIDRRLRSRVDPADIVQETHLEAIRRLNTFLKQRPMPFRLWLRQIAHDQTLKAHRRHFGAARRATMREVPLPERSSLLLAQQLAAVGSTASQVVERRQLARRLRAAMARLPEADREVLLMRHFEGLSNQEVGTLLGMEPGTVSKRHGRAMLRLHRILIESGMTESKL